MNFTDLEEPAVPHFVLCFDGFYDPATSKDCVLGPRPDVVAEEEIIAMSMVLEILIQATIPAISSKLECYVNFALGRNVSALCF